MRILNSKQITRPAHTSAQSRKNYFIWLWSQTAVIILLACGLIIEGLWTYNQTMALLNSSNNYMMEEVGIEATTELNKIGLNAAEAVIGKKMNPAPLPSKTRNIFNYDSYIQINADGRPAVTASSTVAAAI